MFWNNQGRWKLTALLTAIAVYVLVAGSGIIQAGTIYVDADAVGNNDGSSWTNAYNSLEEALKCGAKAGDEVWVAAGTYKPNGFCCSSPCNIVERGSFNLVNDVAIYGGFAGTEDPASFDLSDRDFEMNETILSGDVGIEGDPSDNSYHVVADTKTDSTAILDGFTITGGYADGSDQYGKGGGIYLLDSDAKITNCTMKDNFAAFGGGMYIESGSPGVTNCLFSGNFAKVDGGGLYVYGGSPRIVNSIVSENAAGSAVGGIYLDSSCHILLNNTVTSNTPGGIYDYSSHICLAWGYELPAQSITKCILWGNDEFDLKASEKSGLKITHSDFGILVGNIAFKVNNISADPMFVNPLAGDYHLKAGSPCIDDSREISNVLLPATDIDGNPRVADGDGDGLAFADMGAFEAIAGTTSPGTDIVIQPEDPATGDTPVTLEFANVTAGGVTTVNSTTPGEQQGPPQGFKFGNPPVIYEIATTAEYTGDITVCFDYSGASYGNEDKLSLFHKTDSGWVDVTTSIDTVNKIICGTVTSFSFFGIFESEAKGATELLKELAGMVIGLNLQQGISNSLDAKLDAALKALEDVNANNDAAAVNTLEAFINAAQAQSGDKIPTEDANALIEIAKKIIVALSSD